MNNEGDMVKSMQKSWKSHEKQHGTWRFWPGLEWPQGLHLLASMQKRRWSPDAFGCSTAARVVDWRTATALLSQSFGDQLKGFKDLKRFSSAIELFPFVTWGRPCFRPLIEQRGVFVT